MLNEFRKSINSYLVERTTSPLYGALIINWLVWNWRIIVLLFFVSENKIPADEKGQVITKIEYIDKYYINQVHTLWGPIISTIIFITLFQFASNFAYYIFIRFKQWRVEKKQIVEKKQLLSFEQSSILRSEMELQVTRYEKLLNEKETEIIGLRRKGDELKEASEKIKEGNDNLIDNIKQLENANKVYVRLIKRYRPTIEAISPFDPEKLVEIKSPMIGTFLRKASPDKPNIVEIGDQVTIGKPVCIIEAMKLFNEIESEVNGQIIDVLVDDQTPVEYDQPLFLVNPG